MNFSAQKIWLARLGMGAVLLAGTTGCKDYLDVNTSPNQPAAVTPAVLLSGIEVTTGFTAGNELQRATELFIQHAAGTANGPLAYDAYTLRGSFDNQWNFELYAGSLTNTRLLIDQNQATNPYYAGIGKLLRAYNFSIATDLWGDVPYSQASLGNANLAPRYDAQADIYQGNTALGIQSLFDLVRDGLTDINNTTNALVPGTDDVMYGGSRTKWTKFGNMLLLKFATTVSRKNPTLATQVIREVLTKGSAAYITDNSDDAAVPFGTTVGNQNPIYAYNIVNRPLDEMLSRRFLDSLRAPKANDPRLPRFWTTATTSSAAITTPFGIFTGLDNAGTQVAPTLAAQRSRTGVYQTGMSGEAPIQLVTNFQRAFILAEAAIRLGTPGDPQALFQEGIRASMTKAGVSATDITAYFTANPTTVTLAGSNEHKLNQILTQKWIAWCGNGIEAYNDYRRTGYPQLQVVQFPNPESPSSIPRRLFYPNSEINTNTTQIPTPQPSIATAVWWDVR
ncbi:MAG: SusD/RagB family nutrient-binding outer membrane lipoprotein [Janthinobacterium lividum]